MTWDASQARDYHGRFASGTSGTAKAERKALNQQLDARHKGWDLRAWDRPPPRAPLLNRVVADLQTKYPGLTRDRVIDILSGGSHTTGIHAATAGAGTAAAQARVSATLDNFKPKRGGTPYGRGSGKFRWR